MPLQQFYNSTPTTLTTSILEADDPCIFDVSGDLLPLEPNFCIKIEGEILLVTSVDTSGSPYQYTAERAKEGTTAADHASSVTVVHILTKDSFKNILKEQYEHVDSLNTSDHRSGRIQSVRHGLSVDTGGFTYYHHNGMKLDPFDPTLYALFNGDSLSIANVEPKVTRFERLTPSNDGFTLYGIPIGSLNNPYLIVGFSLLNGSIVGGTLDGLSAVGVAAYDNSDDKHIVYSHGIQNTAPYVHQKIVRFTDFSTVDSTPQAAFATLDREVIYLKMEFDGTNILCSYSYNYTDWTQIASLDQTYLTISHLCLAFSPNTLTHVFHCED